MSIRNHFGAAEPGRAASAHARQFLAAMTDPVTLAPMSEPTMLTDCGHSFEGATVNNFFRTQAQRPNCPMCRAPVLSPPRPNYLARSMLEAARGHASSGVGTPPGRGSTASAQRAGDALVRGLGQCLPRPAPDAPVRRQTTFSLCTLLAGIHVAIACPTLQRHFDGLALGLVVGFALNSLRAQLNVHAFVVAAASFFAAVNVAARIGGSERILELAAAAQMPLLGSSLLQIFILANDLGVMLRASANETRRGTEPTTRHRRAS